MFKMSEYLLSFFVVELVTPNSEITLLAVGGSIIKVILCGYLLYQVTEGRIRGGTRVCTSIPSLCV